MELQPIDPTNLISIQLNIMSITRCAMICSSEITCQTFEYDSFQGICRLFAVWTDESKIISSLTLTFRVGYVRQISDLYSLYSQPCISLYDIHRYLSCTNNNQWSCPIGQFYNGSVCQNEYNITLTTPDNQYQCTNNRTMHWNGTHCVPISISGCFWNTTGITVAGVPGPPSTAPDRLFLPSGLIFDETDTLYITDQNNNRIQRWRMNARNGTTVAGAANGASGATSTTLALPNSVLVDSVNNLYIADTNNHRVQLWLFNASSGTTIAGTGVSGSAINQLNSPYDIARDPNTNKLYIADYGNHRVMCYPFDATSGTIVAGGNGQGTGSTQLYSPSGIYFEPSSNSLIIANYGGNNVVRWVLGADTWTLIAGSITGMGGSSSTLLNYPRDVTLDWMGNVYVADTNNHRIQFFKAGESNGTTIAGITNAAGSNPTKLQIPYSLALDSQLNLYVADSYNYRIQKFVRC